MGSANEPAPAKSLSKIHGASKRKATQMDEDLIWTHTQPKLQMRTEIGRRRG